MDIQRDFNAYRDDQANLVFFKLIHLSYRKNGSYSKPEVKTRSRLSKGRRCIPDVAI